MRRNRKLLLIICVILMGIAIVTVGIFKNVERRTEKPLIRETGESAEQTGADEADETAEDPEASEDPGEENAGPLATLFFASDFQVEPGFDEPSVTLSKILAAAEADGKNIDRVVICGDYTNDRLLYDYQMSPDESIAEIRAIVAEKCPDTGTEAEGGEEDADGVDAWSEKGDQKVLFVQGNHDKLTEEITPTGLHEYEDYLIYVLNTEEAFPWKQGKTSGCLAKVKASSAAMKECFDKMIQNGETRPVFIAGHVPLHFTARTSSRHTTGDNLYSSLIFDVVNEAAESLDIIYLAGHNHSKGWDCYMGGSSVYKAKGDTILIPRFDENDVNTDEYTEETLAFTYLNAGYLGYYMNCGTAELDAGTTDQYHAADETLTGTVFEIYPDRIVAARYDAEGVHVLGHAGEADPYKGGIDEGLITDDKYSKETTSPQEIKRN